MDLFCCYAHSFPDKPIGEWQPLEAHLAQTAKKAADFASKMQSADWAWNAGWLHDLGKASDVFQDYLLRANALDEGKDDQGARASINHSSAGAALLDGKENLLNALTLAYIVAGHHAGLTDQHTVQAGEGALSKRMEEGRANLCGIEKAAMEVQSRIRSLDRPPEFVKSAGYHLWVRMIFSCLVDADFLDTEHFIQTDKSLERGRFSDLLSLKVLFDRYMDELAGKSQSTPVSAIRKEVLSASRNAALQSAGLFSMTVPTGGGKTLSSMAFALEHAAKHEKNRIIYVIPYTSIIEQTASILSGIFGPENVIEHHSNFDPEKETLRSRLASENWDAPIIVTTNVQFFESMYAARPGRCRKIHNIINSVVILDEAQMLPPEWLEPCIHIINELVDHYRTTVLLSTATQPALPGLAPPREIISDTAHLYSALKRVKLEFPEDPNAPREWGELAVEIQKFDQVLCIVNSRRDCYNLFSCMSAGTIHLSALMCGAHRSEVIAMIKQKLKEGAAVRVVSTQLVEAGVDIDFPVVFRALAGMDSIAQAAGRCNREGRLPDLGQVKVFVPPSVAPRGLLRKGADTTRELIEPDFDPLQPLAYQQYFNLFYSKANDTGKHWLKQRLQSPPDLQFRTAAKEFQLIDDRAQVAVIVRYSQSDQWIEQLRHAGPTREIMRHLQRYSVNISTGLAEALILDGKLERLDCGVIVQALPGLYSETLGLNIFAEELPVEDLIL